MLKRSLAALALVFAFSSDSLQAAELVVPGVANLRGANGTVFQSDLTLSNPSSNNIDVQIRFIPAPGSSSLSSRSVTLAPHQSVSYGNVLLDLWGITGGGGALSITSPVTLAIRGRTFNATARGSYGLALPTLTDSAMLRAGETGIAPWIAQSADAASGFRTNIGVVFPDAEGGSATVIILDGDGAELGRRTYNASAPSFMQEPVRSIAPSGAVARMTLVAERGSAHAYSSVIDNATGDSSVFAVQRPDPGATDVLVGGAARQAGANGTYFVTDVRIVNPSSATTTVAVHFLPPGIDNSAAPSVAVPIPAYATLELADILGTLFGLPEGTSGALRFRSAGGITVAARTSNIDRSGAGGTFGAQLEAVRIDSLSTSPVNIPAIAQDMQVRTNAGFITGSTAADLSIELRSAGGAHLASASVQLPPYSWWQGNLAALLNLSTVEAGATLRVSSRSGRFSAYASAVDQHSGDASVTQGVATDCVLTVAILAPETACRTDQIVLSATSAADGATYEWHLTNATILSGSGTSRLIVVPQGTGEVGASVIVRSNGCAATGSRIVAVHDQVGVGGVSASKATVGGSVTVTWTATADPDRFELRGNDFSQPVLLPSSQRSYSYVPTSAGNKSVSVSAVSACGMLSAVTTYAVAPAPEGRSSGGVGGRYPGAQTYTGERGREYVVYVPPTYDPAVPARLVYALGGQGEPAAMTLAVGWQQIADRDNVIVVTMTSATSGPGYSGAYDVAEFETIERAEVEVPQRYNIALRQVYYWGFSAGAHVTYMFALANERSQRVAAFAIHAGAIEAAATRSNPASWPPQRGARRLPVFISCGQNDTTGAGGGLLGALRRNRDMLVAEGYPVTTREVRVQGHTYTATDVNQAWKFLQEQKLAD